DPARRDEIVRLLESEGIARNFEARFRRRDGTEITALLNARAVRDSGGKTLYYEGMVTDITDLRRAERAVLEREALLTAVTSSARDAIILMDDEGRVSFWNPAAQRILGWSEQEVLGRSVHEIIAPPRYHDAYRQGFSRFLETGDGPAVGRTLELDALRHDGTEVPVELSLAAVQLKGKWHAIGVVRDISERRLAEKEREQMEVRLRHRQKLEGIGRLAAGIAHEINTPAQYIGDNVRFLKDSFAGLTAALAAHGRLVEAARDGNVTAGLVAEVESALEAADLEFLSAEIPQAIDQTLEGVERVSTIVRAMKEFSHPGSQEKLPTDIHKALESTLIVCRNEYKYVADVQTEFDRSLPLVPCWPCEFNQVMLNLIVNAAQAIQDILGPEPTERGRIRLSTARVDGWAEIRLADSGAGIPPEIRGRVFEPFFTTKEVGKGTGQGLAIAHAVIVGKHGGTIDLESEVGRGTTFIIRLPLEEHAAAAGSPPAVP
ncbi:MAG: PAS domain S-box protein, partial [Acidobacteria bacterium]|nr:PAS domain S-box protein [Acidobacteriota bacterium]